MKTNRSLFFSVIIIAFLVVLFFGHLFFPEPKLFYTPDFARSDIWNFHYPVKDFLSRSLKQGQLPFWSEKMGTGFPLFAEGQIGALYIFNILTFLLFPTWFGWNLSYVILFFISFLGSYLFFRKLGISWKSSLFSAFSFSFGGYFIVQSVHLSYVQSASLMPWLFLLGDYLWKRPSKKYVFLFGVVLSQQLFAGGIQWVFISLLGVILYLAFKLMQQTPDELMKKIVIISFSVLFGIGLSAPQVIPSLELRDNSIRRSGVSLESIFRFPYRPKDLITFVLPNFFGTPKDGTYPSTFETDFGIYWENTAYVGILPLLFFLIAIVKKKKKSWEKAFLFLGVFSLLLALGESTPLSIIFDMPVFNNFRVPSRFLILTTFSLTAVAGAGLDWFTLSFLSKKAKKKVLSHLSSIILLIAIIDLFVYGFSYNLLVPVKDALAAPEVISRLPADGRIFTHSDQEKVWNEVFLEKGWQDASSFVYFKNGLDANLNLVFGKSSVNYYTPFAPLRVLLQEKFIPLLLNVAGVEHIISPSPLEEGDVLKLEYTVEPPRLDLPKYYVYSNLRSLDRFRFVSNYIVESSKNIGVTLQQNEQSFDSTVLLETDLSESFGELITSEINLLEDKDQRLVLRTKTDKKSILVIADSFYPGWEARVNNKKVVIYPANINQRALVVPAGENIVELRFIPRPFYKGIIVSIISLFAFFFLSLSLTQRVVTKIIKKGLKQFKK